MIKLLLFLTFISSAFPREKNPDPFVTESIYPTAELYGAKDEDFFMFLNKRVKAVVEGPYVEIQSIYTYKNARDHLAAALFEFPQVETDISHKIEVRYQDAVRVIFDGANSPKKEYSHEKLDTNERFSYKEIKAGNIRAQDTVEVIFTVMRPLEVKLNQFYELSIRPYHMPRFTYFLTQEFEKTNLNLQIELRSERPFEILANPSHQFQPELSNHTGFYKAFYNVTIEGVPWFAKEFKIYFANSDFNAPQTIMATHPFNPHDHAFMFSLIPDMNYFPSRDYRSFFDPSLRKNVPLALQNLDDPENFWKLKDLTAKSDLDYFPNGYLIMIDRSDSMKGSRLENLKKTLTNLLATLSTSSSYYSILSFGNSSQFHWRSPGDYNPYRTPEETTETMKWVETLEADMGEKDLLSALKYALEDFEWRILPKNVIILTDGEISNMDEIIQIVKANSHSQKICAIWAEPGSEHLLRRIGEAGGCPTEPYDEGVLDVMEATLTPPGFNFAYEITCEDEQNQVVYQEEGGFDGISMDEAFIKWVTLDNIPNLKSCKAKIFYFSQHRCSSMNYEEIEIFSSEKADLTDTWHKVASHAKLTEPEIDKSKRELMINNVQEEEDPISEELIYHEEPSRYEIYQAEFHNLKCYDPKRPLLSGVMLSPSHFHGEENFSSKHGEGEEESFFSFKIICIASVLTLLFVAGLFIML